MDRYRIDWGSWFLPRRHGPRLPPESLNEPHPEDLERLQELRESGSKMKLPHPIRVHLHFASEKDARAAMDALRAEGYSLQVRAEAAERWRVTGVIQLIPTPGTVTHVREEMDKLARSLGGAYTGWECPLVY